jgi:hypothetical protein
LSATSFFHFLHTALNDSDIARLYALETVSSNRLLRLSFNTDVVIDQQPPDDLPKSAVFPRSGFAFLRSGWNFDDLVHVTLHNPPYWVENHQHRDFNSFVVYYKKPLLIDSGNYEPPGMKKKLLLQNVYFFCSGYGSVHWKNYYSRTVAHNTILVMDPSENFGAGYTNDGGQVRPNNNVVHHLPHDLFSTQLSRILHWLKSFPVVAMHVMASNFSQKLLNGHMFVGKQRKHTRVPK